MNIQNFSDLTSFINDENLKLQESFGINVNSKTMIRYVEKTLKRYIKLYDKPLYRRVKRDLELQEAIETMPHSWFWKIFHSKLWNKIKLLKDNEPIQKVESTTIQPETKPIETSLVPVVIKSVSVPVENDF
ncbi:MAG: hypothetical protein IJX17_05720 [Clostridia bacterium]|nr:hypothetical protein [Clostridia bacterium]